MTNYSFNINLKSLDIDQSLQNKLKKIQAIFREIKRVDGSIKQDGSQMYEKQTLEQDLTLSMYGNDYFVIRARSMLSLKNINTIIEISGFECDHVSIREGVLECSFHNRRNRN